VLYLLHRLHEADSWRLVFNLFRYVTFRAAAAAATAFIGTVILLPVLIRLLRRSQILENTAHPHSEELTRLHKQKNGTPTMGGLGILAGVLGASLLWADLANRYVLLAMAMVIALGALGVADDWMKLRGIGLPGMPGRWKLAGQVVVATAVGLILAAGGDGGFSATRLAVPFLKPDIFTPELGPWYAAIAVFLIVGSSNAVNLTDGLDGLASGCSTVAALAYSVLAYIAGHSAIAGYLNVPFIRGAEEMTILCAAMGGALLAFLWYNAHPAEIFMGDTGALAIGGLLGVAACVAKQELLLALVGGVFVLETGSVILQVASFKLRRRRIFRIAPLHLHLRSIGWSEDKVVVRFWIVSIICALMSVATLKVR